MTNTVVLPFENPVNISATDLIQITWEPSTFNIANLGNFSLNLWLIHNDDQSDTVQNSYVNLLLAQNQSVYNNSVYWVPATTSIDVDVPQPGNHQLGWEQTSGNPDALPDVSKDNMGGSSSEFTIFPPAGWSYSSTSAIPAATTPATSITQPPEAPSTGTPLSSTTNNPSNAPSAASHMTILGLSIGLGILFLLCITFLSILLRRRANRIPKISNDKERCKIDYVTKSEVASEAKRQEMDAAQFPMPSELESYPINLSRERGTSSKVWI